MSVTSTTNRKSYAGDAVTTSFATNPVVFFDSSDLAVSVVSAAGVETALTENTHYTVTGGDGSTGTVNLAGGSAPYGAPAAGVTLLILRELPLTQPVDFVQNGGSDAEVQETAYDRLTMMVQQLNEVDARAIKLPPVETGSTALTELPFDRASKFLAFDASKNLIASSGTVDSAVPVSAFMETVLDDTTAAAARTTLGAVGLTGDETIGGVKTFTDIPVVSGAGFLPSGAMLDFGGTSVPSGFLGCDGSNVSRTTYANLFSAIGTTWGAGDGSTTFTLPDFRRRTAVGSGGTGTGTLGNAVGNTGGAETHTLTTGELAAHSHTVAGTIYQFDSGSVNGSVVGGGSGATFNGGASISAENAGSGTAHNNMQPSVVVLKIIKT